MIYLPVYLNAGILDDLFDGLESFTEEVHVQLLKLGECQGLGEIISILKGLDFEPGAHLARKSAFSLLDFTLELAGSALVLRHVAMRRWYQSWS